MHALRFTYYQVAGYIHNLQAEKLKRYLQRRREPARRQVGGRGANAVNESVSGLNKLNKRSRQLTSNLT